MRRSWLIALVLLATMGMIAAACGSDDDGESAETDATEEATAEATEEPTETATEEVPEEATDEPTEEPTEEIVLTDSFRGVTAETITVGLTAIDFETLNSTFNLEIPNQSFAPQYEALIADLNERGGILGREVVLVDREFVPTQNAAAEEVCTELTEDIGVFAVLNGFSGPGTESLNSCFTDLHETVLIGPIPTTEDTIEAGGLWVTPDMSLDRRNSAAVTAMDAAGILDDLGPMMVVGSNPDEQDLVDSFAADLEAVGVEVPVTAVVTTSGDEAATIAEVDVFIEAAETSGVSTVVLLGEGEFRNASFFRARPEWTYIMGNGDRLTRWESMEPTGLEAETRVITNNNGPDSPVTDPQFLRCIELVEEAQGIEVLPASELGDGDPNYWSGTTGACRQIALLEQIATAAGPDLTNDSWVAALDQVPDLVVPGYAYSSFSGEKVDARDSLVLVEYDLDSLTFVPISDPIDVG